MILGILQQTDPNELKKKLQDKIGELRSKRKATDDGKQATKRRRVESKEKGKNKKQKQKEDEEEEEEKEEEEEENDEGEEEEQLMERDEASVFLSNEELLVKYLFIIF